MNTARRLSAAAWVVFCALLWPHGSMAAPSSLVYEGGGGRLAYAPYANQGETNAVNTKSRGPRPTRT
ncbi:MAG: hypothetical protein K9N23_19270 [Akkermansiaceae bacterium]|nr:hypothetical protein [Akkermansiaceae bacterium]